jgi:hypothetical protein
MLAGDRAFVSAFLTVAGGREALRRAFLKHVAAGVCISREFGATLLSDVG